MGLFQRKPRQPAWQNQDGQKALRAVEKSKSQADLERAARYGSEPVRHAAIRKIQDENALFALAMEDGSYRSNYSDVFVAIKNIRDYDHLLELHETWRERNKNLGEHNSGRKAALKIAELVAEKLARIELERVAVDSDTTSLLRYVETGHGGNVKRAAFEKLRAHMSLVDMAVASDAQFIADAAAEQVTDPGDIARLAREAKRSGLRQDMCNKVRDPAILVDIATQIGKRDERNAVLGCITDQTVIAGLIDDTADSRVLDWAVHNLTDRALISDAARGLSGEKNRHTLLMKLGGYVCTSCHQDNWPDSGEAAAPCICRHCRGDNHLFVHSIHITSERRDSESGETYEECKRCGIKKNRESFFRYTDW